MERRRRKATILESPQNGKITHNTNPTTNNKRNRIVINNPLGRERAVDPDKTIRIHLGDAIYRVQIDEKTNSISIHKMGGGKIRGEIDRITMRVETSYQILIK